MNNSLLASAEETNTWDSYICSCGYTAPAVTMTEVPCNVRAFRAERFRVWRCPACQTIHSADQVDLDHYYAQYPFAAAVLTTPLALCYRNLQRQLQGIRPHHRFLDYGCANGLFVQYLRQQGFQHCYGYDLYASTPELKDSAVLEQKFDYILLQDVVEHVEDPLQLLGMLDQLLAPGGCILVGTPNADRINLQQAHRPEYYNSLHAPYHRHIYNPRRLGQFGEAQGWQIAHYFPRPYHDTLWLGLNSRVWNHYQSLYDGTLDVIFEPIRLERAWRSPGFWWHALTGYWLSLQTDMAILFHKPLIF
jgi:2-polyprenyl-3-methyl-5-hydroxy-6-metoxy-1,4-benzoquinol methylase